MRKTIAKTIRKTIILNKRRYLKNWRRTKKQIRKIARLQKRNLLKRGKLITTALNARAHVLLKQTHTIHSMALVVAVTQRRHLRRQLPKIKKATVLAAQNYIKKTRKSTLRTKRQVVNHIRILTPTQRKDIVYYTTLAIIGVGLIIKNLLSW